MNNQKQNRIQEVVNKRFFRENPVIPQNVYRDTIKIPKKTFGKYLRNELQPRLDELQRIANWLGTTPKELF